MKNLKKLSYIALGVSNALFFLYLCLRTPALSYIAILSWAVSLVLLALGNRKINRRFGVTDWIFLAAAAALLIFDIWLLAAAPL